MLFEKNLKLIETYLTFLIIYDTFFKNLYIEYLSKFGTMAVPKKRTSKAKKNARKANWKRKGYKAAQKSLSLAKSMLSGKTTSFVYSVYVDESE